MLIREILAAEGIDPITRPAVKFYLDRKNADLLTIDISRLMLGRDIHCAQCHDHPDRHDYTQAEYKGLFAYLSGSQPYTNPRTHQVYFIQNALNGKVDWGVGAALAAGHLTGGLIGVRLTVLKGHVWIRRVVLAAVIAFALKLWLAP